MADEHNEKITDATRQADRREAQVRGGADREPTPEEEALADENSPDPEVAQSFEEAAERGAKQKGEGRID